MERFYVVGVGASAGGQVALREFFEHVPADVNAAFVVVTHLQRDYKTNLHSILGRHTSLPVDLVQHGQQIERGRIYVMPENTEVAVAEGRLLLAPRAATPGNRAIDAFFHSLAQDQGERAMAVVLSGCGTDGADSVHDIHRMGGRVLVQAPATSAFPTMPVASIAADDPVAIEAPATLGKMVTELAAALTSWH